MTSINSLIPLSADPSATSGPDLGKLMSMAEMANRLKVENMSIARQNALTQIFSNPNALDAQGNVTPQTTRAVMAVDPQMGMKIADDQLTQRVKRTQDQYYQTELGKSKYNFLSGLAGTAINAYDEAKKSGRSEPEALAAARQARNDAVSQSGGILSDDEINRVTNTPFVPAQARAFALSNTDYATQQEKARTSERQDVELGLEKRRLGLAERQETFQEEQARIGTFDKPQEIEYTGPDDKPVQVLAQQNQKTGQWVTADEKRTPIDGKDVRVIKGASAGGAGGREAIFNQRILLSANEAAKDLTNVVSLPTTASTGFFGGRRQEGGLMDAGREVLANTVTGQDAQLYNVMATGFQRSLAAIEASGLAPSGSLSHQMDTMMIKEGDTQLTKLSKLAQIRQVVEAGLETLTTNPRMSKDEKAHADEIRAKLEKAVPFTQADIIKLYSAQQGKPETTLRDVMPKTESDATARGSGDLPKLTGSDADIQKTYGKLKKGDHYLDPDGVERIKK